MAKPSRIFGLLGIVPKAGIRGVSALTLAAPFHTNPKRQRGLPQSLAAQWERPSLTLRVGVRGRLRRSSRTVNPPIRYFGTIPSFVPRRRPKVGRRPTLGRALGGECGRHHVLGLTPQAILCRPHSGAESLPGQSLRG